MTNSLTVLGIESSCDDTAASILSITFKEKILVTSSILSSVVFNQSTIHTSYGGVVPELAARAHTEKLDYSVEVALAKAKVKIDDIDLICVTSGPGLIGAVISGVTFAKALASALRKPIVGVNHLAGHALTPQLIKNTPFPYLVLLASGGHCQFLIVENVSNYKRIGGTIDDAPGEAFDKTAKLLGLGYPGGPQIEKRASFGNPNAFELPKPLIYKDNCNMSFSGLKTAVRREIEKGLTSNKVLPDNIINDLCASFQKTVGEIFVAKGNIAMSNFKRRHPQAPANIALVGGVAANKKIKSQLQRAAKSIDFNTIVPPPDLCTDNAAMIAFAGAKLYLNGKDSKENLIARPRWPLDETAEFLVGSGKKGRKS